MPKCSKGRHSPEQTSESQAWIDDDDEARLQVLCMEMQGIVRLQQVFTGFLFGLQGKASFNAKVCVQAGVMI
ncbi:unnamed protein product [Lathyrus oleraceus]